MCAFVSGLFAAVVISNLTYTRVLTPPFLFTPYPSPVTPDLTPYPLPLIPHPSPSPDAPYLFLFGCS